MVVSEARLLPTTRSKIVLANARRVVDPGCGGDHWGGGDCKTFLYIIEQCLFNRLSRTLSFSMFQLDRNS